MIIPLYSINGLVHMTEAECVYCAVRTESSFLPFILIAIGSASSLSQFLGDYDYLIKHQENYLLSVCSVISPSIVDLCLE
jgi:purine-cytosine permease-like protein